MSSSRWTMMLSMAMGAIMSARAAAGPPATEHAVARMQVIGSGGTTEGTCFLVHQQRDRQTVIHYFLTSARLLNPEPVGERRTVSLRLRLIVDESSVLDTNGSNLLFAGADPGLDVAIVKAVSANTQLIPVPISFEPPSSDASFVVLGRQGDQLTVLTERVRFRSTRLVFGDRTTTDTSGLLGAPAMTDGAAFGLMSECSSTRVPMITLLSAARRFLSLAVPGLIAKPVSTAGVEMETRYWNPLR